MKPSYSNIYKPVSLGAHQYVCTQTKFRHATISENLAKNFVGEELFPFGFPIKVLATFNTG